MTVPRIMIFDSGVGGLSIAAEISQKIPSAQLIFAADNQAFPYGTKEESELIERVDWILSRFLAIESADILVIGCNSASTIILPHLRQRFSIPVVGVVPAIKPAAKASKTKVIGVLATPGTVKRTYTKQLINDFAEGCEVILQGSSRLVELAEDKLRGKLITTEQLQPILNEIHSQPGGNKLDTIVLACTHFPLLKEELASASRRHINWVDSGAAIANHTSTLLQERGFTNLEQNPQSPDNLDNTGVALFAHQTPDIDLLRGALYRRGFRDIRFLE